MLDLVQDATVAKRDASEQSESSRNVFESLAGRPLSTGESYDCSKAPYVYTMSLIDIVNTYVYTTFTLVTGGMPCLSKLALEMRATISVIS
jgi:hypothetical protein